MSKRPKKEGAEAQPIIIKRVKKGGHGHHGGSWKVAYADFVTAMMAFFLLMWLLGSVDQQKREAIGEWFARDMKEVLSRGPHSGGDRLVGKSEGTRKAGILSPGSEQAMEAARLEAFKDAVEQAVRTDSVLNEFQDQIRLESVPEGVRIQLVDEDDRPMFSGGSAQMSPYTKQLLKKISALLAMLPNRVIVSGHTDATPYSGGQAGYSNWELSADRANAARRELVAAGLSDGNFMRVEGLGSTSLADRRNPYNPVNRRISFIVLSKKAETAFARTNAFH